ncbi:MAG: hypothetical protein AAF555_07830 [Verrucomicrobiota bacterium]
MKSLSSRERVMVTLLPAGILMIVYFIFFARPASQESDELRRQIGIWEDRLPSNREQATVLAELRRLEADVKKEQAAAQERKERNESIRAFWDDPDAKAEGGAFIGNLLAENGAVLVEEAVASSEDQQTFTSLLQPLPSAQLWRLRVAGSYEAIRKSMAAIGKTELPLVPAGIEMEPKVEGNQSIHLWNLWICR